MNSLINYLRSGSKFFRQLNDQKHLIITLSKRDFERKYVKNFFGMIWAVVDPFAFVIILYIVFGTRFGNREEMGVPFVTFLLTGYVAYSLFSSSLQNLTKAISDHSFLLKKIDFNVIILPITRMISDLMVHAIVLLISIIIILFNNVFPTIYWLQLLYYIFAMAAFLISTSLFTSSVYLFFPDISNIVGIISRIMFFLTPIFWNTKGLSDKYVLVLKLNPLYYIVNGYRDSLLYQRSILEHPIWAIYYWSFCFLIFIIGIIVFKKLRPHFADVA
jgi:lipopolysaccharide transport system permease protein/teichoic acid transport system permease protein